MTNTRLQASLVKVGDTVLPPVAERCWLKSTMTVLGIESLNHPAGRSKGEWLKITATFLSPYSPPSETKLSQMNFLVKPTSMVSVVI